jgi:ATP-dependent 26S proteasome regulatory subunit
MSSSSQGEAQQKEQKEHEEQKEEQKQEQNEQNEKAQQNQEQQQPPPATMPPVSLGLRKDPSIVFCESCSQQVITVVDSSPSLEAFLGCLV